VVKLRFKLRAIEANSMSGDNTLIPISDEQAKALQEAIKTIRGLGGFIEKALGSVPEDLIGLLGGDWLWVRRAENMVRMMQRAKDRLEARGVEDPQPANLTVALPILRGAADESREELRDLWARLLANAMDPSRANRVRAAFVEVVKKLEPWMLLCCRGYMKAEDSSTAINATN
jgi:Abortive infection alpha